MHEALLQRLLETFRAEAEDRLAAMSAALDTLQGGPAPDLLDRALEELMRAAHSLKGASRVVGLEATESVCQGAETALTRLREQAAVPTAAQTAALRDLVDCLADLPSQPGTAVPTELNSRIATVLETLGASTADRSGAVSASGPETPGEGQNADRATVPEVPRASTRDRFGAESVTGQATSSAAQSVDGADGGPALPVESQAGTVRIPVSRLVRLMGDCEDLLAARLSAGARVQEAHAVCEQIGRWRRQSRTLQSVLHRLRDQQPGGGAGANGTAHAARDLVPWLEQTADMLADLEHGIGRMRGALAADQRLLSGAVDAMLSDVRELLMLPSSSTFAALPKAARDLARDLGREIEVHVQGGDIEADRRVLEALRDPLVHLVRNAVDHGIEPPCERVAAGKPRAGTLTIRVERVQAGRLCISVADDGRGIDPARVREAATTGDSAGAADLAALDDEAVTALVFRSGFSTAPAVTDISGRGLGLAILLDQIERVGGSVSLDSQPGHGTRVSMDVPTDLASFRAILVRAGGREFGVPTAAVQRAIRIEPGEVRRTGSREHLVFEDGSAALVRLADLLGLEDDVDSAPRRRSALVLGPPGARVACLVDAVLGEHEITVKTLAPPLRRVSNVAGLAALGSGRVVPLLHVPDLLVSAASAHTRPDRAQAVEGAAPSRARAVLVAEDSITARTLLEAILHGAGWRVRTAVDGAEALVALREERFDLLVSDVEMPRVDGFELTTRVRGTPELAHLPVVLVTARASREDRERGIAAGANAYVVKSEFDQSDLLDIVERLV